jgi:hypothetical protein
LAQLTFITAIFSYNRGQLLDNCVRSIEFLCPETSVVVFDDGSDDRRTRATLRNIESRGHEVVINDKSPDEMHGGLYRNMNQALDLAIARGWSLVHLMQEDTQFVRHDPELVFELDRLFKELPDACQVTLHFWKTLSRGSGGSLLKDLRVYRASAVCDIGVVHPERLSRAGFRFGPSEHCAALRASSLGLSPYALLHPVIARVPWPLSYKYRAQGGGNERPTEAPLLVKPLGSHVVQHLMTRDVTKLPYGETYIVPWGWRCWSPYPTRPSLGRWLRSLVALAIQGHLSKRLVPRRVGDTNTSAKAVTTVLKTALPDTAGGGRSRPEGLIKLDEQPRRAATTSDSPH